MEAALVTKITQDFPMRFNLYPDSFDFFAVTREDRQCEAIEPERRYCFILVWVVIIAVAIRLYLVERKSAIGPIRHFDWDGPQRRQVFVQWTIWFVRVREPDRRGRNG